MNWFKEIAGLIRPGWGNPPTGKIFISYRRSDTPGIAGRLADSLSEYFGDERVFRDIEDIEEGARFDSTIDATVAGADALVVLIGPNWLDARDSEGRRRLDNEGDWVAREIAAACTRGVRVFPVLVESTPMPRADELPAPIRALASYNAVSLADSRWRHDVTRLAKVISFDLPGSAVERKLDAINVLVCLMVLASIAATALAVAWNAFQHVADHRGALGQGASSPGGHEGLGSSGFTFLTLPQAGGAFVLLFPASVLLLIFAKEMSPRAKQRATAAGLIGFVGSGTAVVALNFFEGQGEVIMLFVASTVLGAAMLAGMSLSGFRPRW